MVEQEQLLPEPLSEREQEIVALIAGGLSNQQIADRLHLTRDTVKWYTRQIYQKLGVHSRTQAVAAARAMQEGSAPVTHQPLPPQRTVFVGRRQELAAIQARLADPACRLLTLLGPGGIGKTRLAIEAARRCLGDYPHGVYFVPFAPVQSPEYVVQTLADGLNLPLSDARSAPEQLAHYLREKTLLLLIDNFEHLLEGAHLLGDVLARATAVKLLVTSRERLRLKEEWVFDVPGLRYPLSGSEAQAAPALTDYEAGQLFLWTAQRAKADFVPDATDQAHVARICQLVDGMPLGIELAASWVRLLPCAEIAAGIAQDLAMLMSVWRNVPERHRSLQAVLDHSWKLLAAAEQDVFHRLTVFAGPFGREAALAVADTSLTMLLALVDKSFVRRVDSDRFSIHELVKQYGSRKLQADPETWRATHLRHCRYFAAFLHERMRAPDAGVHLGEVERTLDDVQMAWRYAVENCRVAEVGQLAAGLQVYYRLRSWYGAGSGASAIYRQALTCFDPDTPSPEHRATLACLYESLGDLQELATAHTDALAAYEQTLANLADDQFVQLGRLHGKIADVWVVLKQLETGHYHYTLAESVLENAPHHDAAWWHEWLRVKTQRMEVFYWQDRQQEMDQLARQIQPWVEEHGTITQRIHYLEMLGRMALRRDRFFNSSDAIVYAGQALALSLETGNLGTVAGVYFSLGFNYLWSEQLDKAEEPLRIAREMAEQSGHLVLLTRVLSYLAVLYRKREDLERTRQYAADALRIAREATMPEYMGMARAQTAWLAWRTGDLAGTKREAEAAIEGWGGLGQVHSVIPFRWLALFPLMGVALQAEEIGQAVHWARHLIAPSQQRLPDDLTALLARAVAEGEQRRWDAAGKLLRQAFQRARESNYI